VTARLSLRLGRRRFSASVAVSALTAMLVALLLALGTWQIQRARLKEALQETYQARQSDEAVRLSSRISEPEPLRFRHVQMKGSYDARHQVLLDNRVRAGRAGYEVFSPFHLEPPGLWVLVDRGWLPGGPTRADLPELLAPAGTLEVAGILDLPPGKTLVLGESEAPGWPKVVQYLDPSEISERLGHRLEPLVVHLDPSAPAGFQREWQLSPIGPGRHYAYALQWFTLAVVVLAVYVALNIRRVAPDHRDEHAVPARPAR
jgi:surfeit locus 1 family protein